MSKELTPIKAFKELKKRYGKNFSCNDDEGCRVVEKELKEKCKNKKQIKAFEIIKKKKVQVIWFGNLRTLQDYNTMVMEQCQLTPEEYELLKEVLL